MKCPNADCGFESDRPSKFCPECGLKMATEQKPRVILCKNITDEGTVCNAELQISFKFCDECGIKVTKEMFEVPAMVCPDCKKEVPMGKKFCSDCGKKVMEKVNQPTDVMTVDTQPDPGIGPCGDRKMPERADPPSSLPLSTKEIDNTAQRSETRGQSDSGEMICPALENETESRKEHPDSNTSKDSGLGLDKDVTVTYFSQHDGKFDDALSTTAMDISAEMDSSNVNESLNVSRESKDDRSSKELAESFDSVSLDSPLPVQTSHNQSYRQNDKQSDTKNEIQTDTQDIQNDTQDKQNDGQNDTISVSSDEEKSDSGEEHSIDNNVGSHSNKTGESETANGRKRKKTTGKKDYKKKRAKKKDKQAEKEKKKNDTEKAGNKNVKVTDYGGAILQHPLMDISEETGSTNISEFGAKDKEETHGAIGGQTSSDYATPGGSNGQMVFGAYKSTVEINVHNYEPKGPPQIGSLFEIGQLYGSQSNDSSHIEKEETMSQKSNEKSENTTQSQAKEKTVTTQTQSTSGPQTRSKTQQDKQNNQQKEALKGKNASTQAKGKDVNQRQVNPRADRQLIQVHFVALISEEFKININTDKVFIRGNLDRESDWNTTKHEMRFTGRCFNGLYEVEYKYEVDFYHLYSGFEYKYLIRREAGKYHWEGYLKNGATGVDSNRFVIYPKSLSIPITDVFYKFEGIINKDPKPKNVVDYIKDFWTNTDFYSKIEKLNTDLNQFMHFFSSHYLVFDHPNCVKDMVNRCELLYYQLRKMYFIDARKIYVETDAKRMVGAVILQHMLGSLATAQEANDHQTALIIALTFVCIVKKFTLTGNGLELNEKQKEALCMAFYIHPAEEQKSCLETQFVIKHCEKLSDTIRDGLVEVMRYIGYGEAKNPVWLYAVPLLHFLGNKSQPFELSPLAKGHQDDKPVWWGLTPPFQQMIEVFKNNNRGWSVPLMTVLEKLEPLFEVDYLLPRTFMASLGLREIKEVIESGKIPVGVCCATLNYFLKKTHRYDSTQRSPEESMLCNAFEAVLTSLQSGVYERNSSEKTVIHLQMGCRISLDLLRNAYKSRSGVSEGLCLRLFHYCMVACTRATKAFLSVESEPSSKKSLPDFDSDTIVALVMDETIDWLKKWKCSWRSYMEISLNAWNELMLSDEFIPKETRDSWNVSLFSCMERDLNLSGYQHRTEEFIKVYCSSVDKFKDCMQEFLSNLVVKAFDRGYHFDIRNLGERERHRLGDLLSGLFVKQWEKTMEASQGSENEKILKLSFTWPPFPSFLKTLNSNHQEDVKKNLLTNDCSEKLVTAISVVERVCGFLNTGEIKVTQLENLQKNEEKLVEVVDLIKNADISGPLVSKLVKLRCKEVEAVKNKAELVTTLTSACSVLPRVDTKKQDTVLAQVAEIGSHSVTDFCQPVDARSVEKIEDFRPTLTAFCLSAEVDQMLELLHQANKSSTFAKLWEQECVRQKDNCAIFEDVVKHVWKPVQTGWRDLSKAIAIGEIHFNHLEHHVGKTYRDDYDKMKMELIIMGINEKIVTKRIQQLQQYRQLATSVKGAKVILQFAGLYHLEGDFQQIKNIATHENVQMKMKEFDESLMDTCRILKDITEKQSHCLGALIKSDPLIKWLKESMKKDGLKELKVFVDLALISAGEQPLDIDRVQGLNTAVLGYSPLIFDLKPDAGYRELLDKCTHVWKELETNPKLPEKLIDSNRHLEWLKTIQKAHGSVEVSSLAQAEAINSGGMFSCGYVWKIQDDIVLEPAKVLKLLVRGMDKTENRNYSYDQLQDLQSRLMLVAGRADKEKTQGKDEVEIFTEVFDGLKRLSSVYIKLYDAGCVLFKTWQASFLCNPQIPVCAILDFGQEVEKIKGRRTKDEDTGYIIHKLAKFLEVCLDEWLHYINEKRNTYLHLNYFTIDQLVLLQRELVKIGTEDEPSLMIYPLLSAVKKDCTPADLNEAIQQAQSQLDQIDEEMSDASSNDETIEDTEDELRQKFIEEIVKAGFERTIAVRALESVKPDQIDEGIVWCMQNEDDLDNEMEEETTTDRPVAEAARAVKLSTPLTHSDSTILSLASTYVKEFAGDDREFGVQPLIKSLEALWKAFIGSISSNLKDYLSLEHLGLILKNLSNKCTFKIDRPLLAGFKPGIPNLVIVPAGDVINTVLTIYMMSDKTDNQPLPQSDEVLLCNSETTLDQVDIFWRRAIFDGGRKTHCLVNADLLDFDVSDRAEKLLEGYIQQTNHEAPDYRLIVICGSDNEYRSRIIAALDKFRRPALPINLYNIAKYLKEKFRVTQAVPGTTPAALVDFDSCSVRVIRSWRAGVGKTLYKERRERQLGMEARGQEHYSVTVPLQEKKINLDAFIKVLLQYTTEPGAPVTRIFHLDISHEVQEGVDFLLFNLLVLRCLTDKTGHVWRRSDLDLYLVENMPLMKTTAKRGGDLQYLHSILSILPSMTCHSPRESLEVLTGETLEGYQPEDQLFDHDMFRSPVFQRPFQYLLRLDTGRQLQDVNPQQVEGTEQDCLRVLLRHCGIHDPSWSELHHFVWFLNTQLHDYEGNNFVSIAAAEDLPGFAKFVLRFLIQMSRDFATRSLKMSEESPVMRMQHDGNHDDDEDDDEAADNVLQRFQMRRTWESSPHPYLFFNSDRMTFTFLGFYIDRQSGNLIDQQTGTVLERGIMAQNLYDALVRNHVPIQENFDRLPRGEKITKLCQVMGMDMPYDPDDTYELTTDNVKKIMAIYMRFRCDIPVIIMGETGCGKTRLVKFMCALQVPPGANATNMVLMKVHGGTTNADIKRKVREAERIAKQNVQRFGPHMYTVLFFDEANTTEAIGLIKEIMCDKTMEGQKLELCQNLKIVAACNPYRKHSEELIKKLEQAGLGYHVDADKTTDRLGRVPMRRLVYRVQPLPQSLLPLVWDFGQLNTQVEDLYIRQMVRRYIRERKLPDIPGLVEVVSAVLTASQDFMRRQEDECSFVSLRDVDRVLSVMSWFYGQSQHPRTLFDQMDRELYGEGADEEDYIEEEEEEEVEDQVPARRRTIDEITRSLILALGVCYHACLKDREEYRDHVVQYFLQPCELPGGADQMLAEIVTCQDVFLSNVRLEKNIARNMALKENVFMMVVCIELRIPLFLVGKPGSSKSLAKTIVSDAMQGNAAHEQLFKELKQVQMVSFQCSPLSTPDGIVGTFRQCAKFQEDKDLNNFVSIVVLDEVGLAEDSPRMPLKTLHPLLEDGCQGDEKPEEYKKVAFIGISNWALDPAKMNRGILVQREVPDIEELKNSAEGICSNDETVKRLMKPLIEPMANSYLRIFDEASNHREFFGLRDFYSLIKMVFSFVEKSKQPPTWFEMLHAIKRNFGGLEDIHVDPEGLFRVALTGKINISDQRRDGDPDCAPSALIEACLFDTNRTDSESRYLLLLTENYGALPLLQQQIIAKQNEIRPVTIFGSSFPSDQEYTQVCRNINKIKVCMETGNTVVLLNLENLYESLYDALNQYYVYFGGERYVDLGLGTHRVKCRVHKQFRLIVVAEKQVVYDKFPIPLINRLEKHFLTINTMLSREQHKIVEELKTWAKNFVEQKRMRYEQNRTKQGYSIGDVFMGYHDDTCSAVVLYVWRDFTRADRDEAMKQILSDAKQLLLWVATPDSVVRLQKSELPVDEQRVLQASYWQQQTHNSLAEYLRHKLLEEGNKELFAQVTTHSKLLSTSDRVDISTATDIEVPNIMLETLQSFDTEQQFSNKIKSHLQNSERETTLLIVQCDSGNINGPLAACARYCVMDEYQKIRETMRFPFHVVFIIQLPRIAGGCFTGFQCGIWHSAHIDDLRPSEEGSPTIQQMQTTSPGTLVQHAIEGPVAMETDDAAPVVLYDRQEEMDTIVNERPQEETMDWEEGRPLGMMGQRPDAVQLDDVIVQLQNRVGQLDRGPKINISAIILSCVQTALSMVKDRETDVSRTTKRVALVLELLQRQADHGTTPTFFTGISRLIAQLLQEKEKNHFRAENWLLEEAVKDENVQKAGTFRRACLQVLESKIAPILAGIVAYLDTNHNLDLLTQTESPWKQQLWLTVLNTPGALQLSYDYLQSPTRQSELKEVVVMTTGSEGHLFSAHMPFSWLIYRQLTEILQTPHPDTGDDEGNQESETDRKLQLFERVLRESTLGKILVAMDNYDIRQDMTSTYLIDYVHYVYHAKSEEELALVCQSVDYKVAQLIVTSQEDDSILQSLISVHQAYQMLAPRLKYFRAMNAVWPECSSKIMDLKQADPKNEMFTEEEFTFSALCLLIEDLTPNKDELNDANRRTGWLNKVHRYRPVIEKVISLHLEDPHIFGEHSQASVHKAKSLWSRVLVVKLFLEHVCSKATEEKTDKITVKHCMPLFLMLGENVDFKQLKSLVTVEKFLKQCNKTAVQTFMATKETCCQCEKTMDEDAPIILPCKHMVCEHCLIDLMEENSKCPTCKEEIPADFDRTKTKGKMSAEISKLKDYQKRCNSFFMDLVSQLCFAENTPPTDDVIDKLLGYIVCTIQPRRTAVGQKIQLTKELTIFDSGIDPNPVFRSFLLQLLMRTSGPTVENNLGKYLRQAEGLLQTGNVDVEQHSIELCLMVIQCLEDIFNQEAEKDSEIHTATNRLRHAKTSLCSETLDINKLYAIAFARYGLAVVAKCIQKAVSKGVNVLNQHERRLLEAAQALCVDTDSKWPKIYLVKYLCRCYGVDAYQAVCRSQAPCLRWLNMADLNREQVVEGPDRFVVCGPTYTDIREALTRVILGEGLEKLQDKMQELQMARVHTDVMLTLAIHREIACSRLYPENKRRVTENVKNHIQEFCGTRTGKQKDLALAVLQNKLGTYCRQLTVREGDDLRLQGILGILVHFLSVLQQLEGANTLMQPLIGLMKQPQQYARSFIPTMPQDDLADIKEALLAARQRDGNENPVLYRCPNGHPYVIGNCGRPAYLGQCKCGANIGGQGYQLQPGNIQDTGEDRSEVGHILGRADVRGQVHVQERQLSPVHCTCLRLLTHMAMYLGAANDPQAVEHVIKPDMIAQDIPQFLWDHIEADLNNFRRILGCSIDDVFILMHSIINNIMITHNQGDHIGNEMSGLQTKKGRENWEERFSKTHLAPILQNTDTTLKHGTRLMGQDQRLGADPLLCLLYEIDTPQDRIPPNQLQDIPSVWRYRTHITMDHLRREFDSKISTDKKGKSKHPVLKLFLQEEHCLRALRHIPSILKLQRALFQKYQRKLDKAEASTIYVENIKRDMIAGEETGQLVADVAEAWNLIRNSLELYACPTELGGVTVPKDLCRTPITDKTPISVLLPTMKESGLCTFALLDFLLRKQNDFLDKYMKETRRNPDSFTSVSPVDITAAHLISYDPQQDILPMVLANCQYSFEIGKGTKIEYDFKGLERQLMDRFFYSKSRINIERVLEIETMIYRAEFTNAAVFKKLNEKIQQETLTSAVKHQIGAEIRSLPDLCQSLDNLDISISFLKSVGGDPDQNLHSFMLETLKMDKPLLSQKARQECRFKHTESLWMWLSFLRTKEMAKHRQGRQSMFESVPQEFHEELSEDLMVDLETYFREMSIEKLAVFIEVLHEYIILGVSVKMNQNDEDFEDTTNRKLKDWLRGYLMEQDPSPMDDRVLANFPDNILYKHAVALWIRGYNMLCEKQDGRRR